MTRRTMRPARWCFASFLGVSVPVLDAAAQTGSGPAPPVSVAVVGGVNLASLSLPFDLFDLEGLDFAITNSRRLGLVGGVLVDVQATPRVVLETGALISVKGTEVNVAIPGLGSASADIRMIYLDVPALARIHVARSGNRRLHFLAGPTVSIKLHARARAAAAGEEFDQEFTSDIPTLDVGLTVGGQVDVGRALVDVRYTHGLRNTATGPEAAGETVKHRVLSFMAGWRF